MTIDAFNIALELATEKGLEFDIPRPVSEKLIKRCEDAINFPLPASYRTFLLKYGFGGIDAVEYCGLLEGQLDEKYFLNAYWVTQEVHRQFGLPNDLFVIQKIEDGVTCLLLSQMEKEECPVILWDFSEDIERQQKKPYILANSFGEHFLKSIQYIIEDDL
ncbi:SMI1/KNR4 family protein [Halodesulfovibrio spirochaetisodalis]|uniref:Knr4/Smi1-like domain-containing protein n=1 Tax=Halodesulfovibrio spirochaetisodalis TaxID=1560234 RepID=A0A1B7XAV4_9BACT|nr:SMI1/KNR4 family protein [Halodesulfovibrio spirochaetisodalis]OBQ46485.1 hypothetical protein SP90_12360 [Halodesulfovibrio spirochaetisodalis]